MNRGSLLIVASAVFFGSTFPAIRYGLRDGDLGPFAFAFYRFAVASLVIVLYALARRRVDLRLFRQPHVLGLGVLVTLAYATQFAAQDVTTASKTSLLVNIHVVTVALLGAAYLDERHGRTMYLAILLGLAGSFALATGGDLATLRFANAEFLGDALAFASGALWAVYTVGFKRFLERHPSTDGVALATTLFLLIAFLFLPLTAATDGFAIPWNVPALSAILYLGLFATAAGFLLWQEGMRSVPATASSVLLLVEIVVALGLSLAFLDERLGWWGAAGALAIVVAAVLASRSADATERQREAPLAAP